ncbi:MAG: glycosyltransferase family 2 protein [Solirubrobacterales bacterium]|nr:glycosyltransferase family 2 protein [Solirubrobacterales bacterium]
MDHPSTHWTRFPPTVLDKQEHTLAHWADDHRAARERYRAKADPVAGRKRSRAIVTMVHNEKYFLPIWLRYYSRFFAPEDIYILDNETTDGSTDGGEFHRETVRCDRVDHTWMVRTMEAKQHELFAAGYDMVMVTDVDELVVPDPSVGDLGTYMDTMIEEFVSCMGYEIIHLPDREPPLDPTRPILEQRGYWAEQGAYNKSALATAPSRWEPGFHRREDGHFRPDPDLLMIHLHRVDYEACRERHRLRSDRSWEKLDDESGWAVHNRLFDGDAFDRWFFQETGFAGFPLRIEEIPENWKGAA